VRIAIPVALLLACASAGAAMDIDAFWEYSDPAASEARFRAALPAATGDERLELLTQIARTHSLRGEFGRAHALLDEVERQLDRSAAAPRARYLLERGRSFNSAGEQQRAVALFRQAWELARASGLPGLAVDAAHMLAIVEEPVAAAQWTERGLAVARDSAEAKSRALLPALLNNHAWNLHDAGRYADALAAFREAQSAWQATGRQPQGRIATWSVGRSLRSLGRHDEALALQLQLQREWEAAGGADGTVFEEIAENLEALGRREEATGYFRRAAAELGREPSFARDQPARWQRIKALARR
jgi:tetratricopeptide (TPR) repeat protein